jgi:hypothetical protein
VAAVPLNPQPALAFSINLPRRVSTIAPLALCFVSGEQVRCSTGTDMTLPLCTPSLLFACRAASLLQGSVRLYEYSEGAEGPSLFTAFTLSKTFLAIVATLDCEDHVTAAALSPSKKTLAIAVYGSEFLSFDLAHATVKVHADGCVGGLSWRAIFMGSRVRLHRCVRIRSGLLLRSQESTCMGDSCVQVCTQSGAGYEQCVSKLMWRVSILPATKQACCSTPLGYAAR